MKRKILALITAIILTFTVVPPILNVNADETDLSGVIMTGEAGATGTIWTYDWSTSTLTFSGYNVYRYRCDGYGFADRVKHIVIEQGVNYFSTDSLGSEFPNIETVSIPQSMNSFSTGILKSSTKLTEITVDSKCSYYMSIDGNLYTKKQSKIHTLTQYAIAKTDEVFVLPDGVKAVGKSAFSGEEELKELVLPESCEEISLPFSGCDIKKITIYNPDCEIAMGEGSENITICGYINSNVEKQCKELGLNFEELEVPAARSISVAQLPDDTEVVVGRVFKSDGLELDVMYSNDTKGRVHAGYTLSEVNVDTLGVKTVEVTYGGATTSFEINIVEIPEQDILTVDNPVWTRKEQDWDPCREFYFTPKISGIYRFYTTGMIDSYSSADSEGILMDMKENILAEDDDSGSGNNFSIEYELEGGKTYILRTDSYLSGSEYSFFVWVGLIQATTECNHSYDDIIEIVSPTCTSEGYSVYKCSICSGTKKADLIDVVNHEFTDAVVIKKATCTENGYTIYQCKNCYTAITRDAIDVLGHDYTDTVISPTVTEYGYTLHECGRCNTSFKTNWTDPVVENTAFGDEQETTTSEERKTTNPQQEEITTPQQKVEDKTTAAEKLAKPKVKAKRSGKKIKLTLRSKNKGVKFQIFVKKNGKYKKIKTTKKKYTFKHAKKCRIKVRTIKYNGKKRIYSKFRKISI